MRRIAAKITAWMLDTRGATAIEYGLMMVAFSMALMLIVFSMGDGLNTIFQKAVDKMDSVLN